MKGGTSLFAESRYGTKAFLALAVLWSVTLAAGYVLARHTPLAYIQSQIDVSGQDAITRISLSRTDADYLVGELARAGITNRGDETTVLAVLKWTMNQVQQVSPNDAVSAREVLVMARNGEGFLCGGMALLFHQALQALNIRARLVYLQRGFLDLDDIHVTVEVWVDGAWRVYDPTFHVALVRSGKRVGIADAYEWFIQRRGEPVRFDFLGDVRYPVRLETYYIRYENLLNNAFVALEYPSSRARLIPVLGPLWAPEWVLVSQEVGITGYLFGYRLLYVIGFIVLPIASLLLALYVVALPSRSRVRHSF